VGRAIGGFENVYNFFAGGMEERAHDVDR